MVADFLVAARSELNKLGSILCMSDTNDINRLSSPCSIISNISEVSVRHETRGLYLAQAAPRSSVSSIKSPDLSGIPDTRVSSVMFSTDPFMDTRAPIAFVIGNCPGSK